jgi:hypothetical protein
VLLKVLASSLKADFVEAIDSAKRLKNFAVRDIRK